MDIEIVEIGRGRASPRPGATTAPAHTLYDIVRKLPDGAQVELETAGDGSSLIDPRRPLALHAAVPAARRLPGDGRGRPAAPLPLPATDLTG